MKISKYRLGILFQARICENGVGLIYIIIIKRTIHSYKFLLKKD